MAGMVFGEIGRAPEVGDEVTIDGLILRVIEIEGSRIQRLEVEFREKLPEPEQRWSSDASDQASGQGDLRRAELPRPRGGAGREAAGGAAPLRQVADGADRAGRPDRAARDLEARSTTRRSSAW